MDEEEPFLAHKGLTDQIIGAAIEVHRALGPGLMESAYRECLTHELHLRGLKFDTELPVSIEYKGKLIANAYRLDFLVEDTVIVELKAVEKILVIHEAQLLTYLKLYHKHVGLLINFCVPVIKDGIVRRVL